MGETDVGVQRNVCCAGRWFFATARICVWTTRCSEPMPFTPGFLSGLHSKQAGINIEPLK